MWVKLASLSACPGCCAARRVGGVVCCGSGACHEAVPAAWVPALRSSAARRTASGTRGLVIWFGRNTQIAVHPASQKFSAWLLAQITSVWWPSRPDRGASAIVTNVGTGCGGREGALDEQR